MGYRLHLTRTTQRLRFWPSENVERTRWSKAAFNIWNELPLPLPRRGALPGQFLRLPYTVAPSI